MRRQLEIEAALALSADGSTIRIDGRGQQLTADLPDLHTAFRALRVGRYYADGLDDWLRCAGLSFELRIRHLPIGKLGAGARPSRLSSWAGFQNAEFHPFRLVVAFFRSLFSES